MSIMTTGATAAIAATARLACRRLPFVAAATSVEASSASPATRAHSHGAGSSAASSATPDAISRSP